MLPNGALFWHALLAWSIDRWHQAFGRPRPAFIGQHQRWTATSAWSTLRSTFVKTTSG
jgi:hypothetical protein